MHNIKDHIIAGIYRNIFFQIDSSILDCLSFTSILNCRKS